MMVYVSKKDSSGVDEKSYIIYERVCGIIYERVCDSSSVDEKSFRFRFHFCFCNLPRGSHFLECTRPLRTFIQSAITHLHLSTGRSISGLAPLVMMVSFTLIATKSIPMVSCWSMSNASSSFVHTPSVPATEYESPKGNKPPKPPIPGVIFAIRRTSSVPASLSVRPFALAAILHSPSRVTKRIAVLAQARDRSSLQENPVMDSNGASNTITGMKVRRSAPEDALHLARSCYDSFLAFNESVGIPQRLDFVNFESAMELMQQLFSKPEVFGVVAVEGASGSIMAGGFLFPGDMYEIVLIFTDNAFQGRGAAKAVMISLLEKAKSDNAKSIRLNQISANVRSFALYASLGFLPVDCWMALEGCVTSEQAMSAIHSIGYQLPTQVHVRKMEGADVKSCNDLHIKVNGLGRAPEIRDLLSDSWVATRDGQIVAYSTGFNLVGHAVAETEEALVLLFTEVCLRRAATAPLPTLHVLGRLYPRLLQWALAAKLKVRRSCWLMVIGFYQSPQHGMIYSPSINA